MKQQRVVHDVIAYNAFVSACNNGEQPEQALEVFADMSQQKVVPHVVTYHALISACEKG